MGQSKRQLKALAALNLDLFRPDSVVLPAPATLYTKIAAGAGSRIEAVSSLDLDISFSPGAELPEVQELYHLFERYNWMYFEGRLPRPVIEYSSRMTSAGSYIPLRHLIRIGRKYHEIFPDEIGDTLKHEMIHMIHLKHDAAFKAEATRIGASVRARSHPQLRKPPRYIYVCDNCGTEYPRQKRLRMASCGICSRGRVYDPRFKLRLKDSLKRQRRRFNR